MLWNYVFQSFVQKERAMTIKYFTDTDTARIDFTEESVLGLGGTLFGPFHAVPNRIFT
jgi:hypothetical protein